MYKIKLNKDKCSIYKNELQNQGRGLQPKVSNQNLKHPGLSFIDLVLALAHVTRKESSIEELTFVTSQRTRYQPMIYRYGFCPLYAWCTYMELEYTQYLSLFVTTKSYSRSNSLKWQSFVTNTLFERTIKRRDQIKKLPCCLDSPLHRSQRMRR